MSFQFLGDADYTSSNKTFNLTTTTPYSYGYAYIEGNPALNYLQSAYYFTPANSNIAFTYQTFIGDTNSNVQVKYSNSNIEITLSGLYIYTSNVNSVTQYNSSNNILLNMINNKLFVKYNNNPLVVLSNASFIPQSYETSAYVSLYGVNSPQSSNFIHRIRNHFLKNQFGIENNTIFNSNVSIVGNLIVPTINHCVVGSVGYGNAWAGFAHSNQATSNSYGLMQATDGTTLINCSNNKTIGFRIGNNEHMTLTGGNIGIGTQTPTAKLHVNGSLYINSTSTFANTSTFTSSLLANGQVTFSNLVEARSTIATSNQNVFEFGRNRTKQVDAGKIGYETFTSGALDIVGAGTVAGSRTVKVFDNLTVDKTVNALTVSTSNLTINTTLKMGGLGTDIKTIVATKFNLGTNLGGQQKTFEVYLGFNCTNYLVFLTPEIDYNGQHDFTLTVGAKLNDYFKIYARRADAGFWGTDLYAHVMVVCLATPT